MPQNIEESHEINPLLRYPWRKYWPDPGPDWNGILSSLDKTAPVQLAAIQLTFAAKEIEAQKTVLDARLKAIGAIQDVIKSASVK